MAHKKGEGSTQNGRDSKSKRLGVKLFGGQTAQSGSIIIRQRGTKYHPGENVFLGKDFTVHAAVAGKVAFKKGRRNRTYVSIIPFAEVAETLDTKPKQKPAPKPVQEVVEVPLAKTVTTAEPPVVETPKAEEPAAEMVAKAPVSDAPEAPVEETAIEPEPASEEPAAETTEADAENTPAAVEEPAEAQQMAPSQKDNLKIVEGIGPKIESLLNDAGIYTFAELSQADPDKIREILEAAGPRYRIHDPATWAQQAGMAAEGKMDELKEWQDQLKGGKEEA